MCACLDQQLFSTSLLLVCEFKDSSVAPSLYFFMCMGVFPAFICLHYIWTVPVEARRGHCIPWD